MSYYLYVLTFLFFSCNQQSNKILKSVQVNLDSLVKIYPDSVPLLVRLGNEYLNKYEYSSALIYGAKSFRLDSNNLEARFLYANALNNISGRKIEDIAQAQRHFLKIISKQSNNKKAFIALASTYTQLGEFDKSFLYINEVLRKDPKYRDAYVLKGTNYLTLGKRDLALSSYETAIQQDPNFFEAYLKLGWMYTEDKKYAIAYEKYKTASELQNTSIDAWYGMAYCKQQLEQFDEALNTYRLILDKDTSVYHALFNQGYIKQFHQNQLDSAMYFYESTLKVNPEYENAWHNLGLCYITKKDKQSALRCFSKALKYNPQFEISRIEANKLR